MSAHKDGYFVAPPQFNFDNTWKALEAFFTNMDKVKEECWSSVLQFGSVIDEDEDVALDSDAHADQSIIFAYRADMCIPSSPLKEWIFLCCIFFSRFLLSLRVELSILISI